MKPLFLKKVDRSKLSKGGCLMSEDDLGYRGLFGIRWGWLKFKWDMFEMMFIIKHKWYSSLKWNIRKLRYKSYVDMKGDFYIRDRLLFKSKKIGVLR